MDTLNREKLEKAQREEQAKKEHKEKLKQLLGEDSDDMLDVGKYQNLAGDGLFNYLHRIENHLKAEENLIFAWQGNDAAI